LIITDVYLEGFYWVEINLVGNMLRHYEEKGYTIPYRKDNRGRIRVPRDARILVKVEDLLDNSNMKVDKLCDDCGTLIKNQSYQMVIKRRKLNDGIDRCKPCGSKLAGIKRRENTKLEDSLSYNYPHLTAYWDEKLNNPVKIEHVHHKSALSYWWKCVECNESFCRSVEVFIQLKNSCPYCSTHPKVVNKKISISTTHPHVVEMLEDKSWGDRLTSGTHKKLNFICPKCGTLRKNLYVNNVIRRGLPCYVCSDRISYPEKLMFNILTQLEIDFEIEKIFAWSKNLKHSVKILNGNKRYDFYIPKHKLLIETHGGQHYKENTFNYLGGKTLEEERENDKIKKELAIKNGFKYIEIDCSRSEIDYIKNNIISSELNSYINLSEIDWVEAHLMSCTSKIFIVYELFVKTNGDLDKISDEMKLSIYSVKEYLRKHGDLKRQIENTKKVIN